MICSANPCQLAVRSQRDHGVVRAGRVRTSRSRIESETGRRARRLRRGGDGGENILRGNDSKYYRIALNIPTVLVGRPRTFHGMSNGCGSVAPMLTIN
ncbi:hypothetical protein J6590_019481 [Homalodisca vitripennis]|nr:hypothetical protein J6590_019481 [Homalodisca vitripennis]